MTTTEFQTLVKEMRQAQIDYFRTRDKDCLNAARRLEKRVDKALEEQLTLPLPDNFVEWKNVGISDNPTEPMKGSWRAPDK